MCHDNNQKHKTTSDGRNKLPNPDKTLGEKETYRYLEILEADTIKHAEMKKISNDPEERENY